MSGGRYPIAHKELRVIVADQGEIAASRRQFTSRPHIRPLAAVRLKVVACRALQRLIEQLFSSIRYDVSVSQPNSSMVYAQNAQFQF
jgi:hypothetical protein